jgi:predicted dehydrogenase
MIAAAIVGLGRWGQSFVSAMQGNHDRLRFVRAVDVAPEATRDFAVRNGLALGTNYADALADAEVDAVVLATPHSLHLDQVIAAARAGKPVFCEKPLALKASDAARMIDACRRANVVLGVGHNRRWWPAMQALKRAVAAGEIGKLLHIEAHNSNENSNNVLGGWRTDPTESPGGGMTGAGLHALDALISVAGPARWVHARLSERKPPPAPLDTASALLEFADGTSGLLATVRATPFFWRVHAFGSEGSAEALGETEMILRKTGTAPTRVTLDPVDSLRAELEAFADAIDGRATFPISQTQMLQTVTAFEAVIRSLDTREPVSLPERPLLAGE